MTHRFIEDELEKDFPTDSYTLSILKLSLVKVVKFAYSIIVTLEMKVVYKKMALMLANIAFSNQMFKTKRDNNQKNFNRVTKLW